MVLAHSSSAWELPPAVLLGLALALVLFVQAFVRLRRRRPEHAPWSRAVLYAAAHPAVHDLEHLSFFVAGLLAWTQLVDPARHERLRRPQRVFFALGMLALSQPLVDALLFSTSPAYLPRYDGAHGISALTDQRLAGVVMMTEQLLTLGICVALLLRPYVRERQRKPAFT